MRPLSVLLIIAASSAHAATFSVNSTTDAVDAALGDGICAAATGARTLRAAVLETNALAGADTITLPAGVYILSLTGIDEDIAATGDLDINDDLTIAGDFAPPTIVDGNATDRVFEIGPAVTVRLSNLTVQNGDGAAGFGTMTRGRSPSPTALSRRTATRTSALEAVWSIWVASPRATPQLAETCPAESPKVPQFST